MEKKGLYLVGITPWGSRGFSLLETLIAMCVMGFIFLNLPGVLLVMERIEGENTLRAWTLLCAQEKMESLLFDSLRGGLSTGEGMELLQSGPYERMERRWEINSSPLGTSLLHVRTECSCPWRRGEIRNGVETLMMASN